MNSRISLSVAIAILVLVIPAFSQTRPHKAAPTLWGKVLPAQPSDTRPFHEVALPDWLEETTRVTYCFSAIDSAMRDRAQRCGSQMSEINFVSPFFANYPSVFLKKRDPNLPPDYIQREITDYKRRHVRILAVFPPGLQGEIYALHPDWRRIYTDTHTIPQADMNATPFGGPLCLLGPWSDMLIDILAEILTKYPDVDAFSFDGLHHSGYCYCEHCRDNYRKETGQEIPAVNMNDAAFRRYQLWEDRRLEALLERIQIRLKGIKPTVALVSWTTNAGRFGHFLDIPRNMSARTNLLLDAPDQEFWMDETNRGNTLVPAFANAVIWAMSDHRVAFSTPYLLSHGNPYGADSFPPQDVLPRVLLALTYGARPNMALAQPPLLRDATYRSLQEIVRREPWITHVQPERWAALLLSDTTRVFYGREPGRVEERSLANVLGVFRTGVEEHLPLTVISDWNLNADDLSHYKVLILPNAACLSETQARAVADFVRRGGGLVATLDTSLCDEMGNPRKDFALADVFGVHYRGVPQGEGGKTEALDVNSLQGLDADYWEKRKNIYDFRMAKDALKDPPWADPRLHAYIGEESVTFKGQAVAVGGVSAEARTVGTFAVRGATGTSLPGIVTHPYGKGHVVYMAAGFDAAYYLYAYPYQRLVLAAAIRQVAPAPFGITIDAPMCVHTTFFRQNKAQRSRLVIHLYNDINNTSGHAKPDDDVPLREEVIPIHAIRVRFTGYHITGIHLEPEGRALPMQRTRTGVEVVVPVLYIHSLVVAELAP